MHVCVLLTLSLISILTAVTCLKEAENAFRWGMDGFETKEVDRPEFRGQLKKSFINGKDIVSIFIDSM
jgi:hypothetical protein